MHQEAFREEPRVAFRDGLLEGWEEADDLFPLDEGKLALAPFGKQPWEFTPEKVPLAVQGVVGRQVGQLGVVDRPAQAHRFWHDLALIRPGFHPKVPSDAAPTGPSELPAPAPL